MSARLLLLLLSLAFVVGVAEVLLPRFAPQRTAAFERARHPAIFQPGDPMPYSLIPHAVSRMARKEFDETVRINSLGYRDDEFEFEKPKDTLRVISVGDSFTFGWGVANDETYPQQLEKLLGERNPSQDFEVINAGFASGFYPPTYYLYLKRQAFDLDPDLITIGLFIGNDIDHSRAGELDGMQADENGLPLRFDQGAKFRNGHFESKIKKFRWRYPLLRDSEVFQLFAEGVRTIGKKLKDPVEGWIREPYMYVEPYPMRTQKRLARIEKVLLAIRDLARERKTPLLIVMIPTVEQVYVDAGPVEENHDLEKPQRILGEFFRREGINYVDLLPELRKAGHDRDLYFWLDQHYNANGNRATAEILVASVEAILSDGVAYRH